MEERKFKTSAKCMGCVNAIAAKLNNVVSQENWSIDLTSPDRVLTVKSDAADGDIVKAVTEAGFKIEKL